MAAGAIRESRLVERLIASNPGPFTGPGTNTYLIGTGDRRAVLDPGPEDPAHIDRILAVAEDAHAFIDLILVTHSHPDHLPGARFLRDKTRAPLAADGRIRGVDRPLSHGQRVPLPGCFVDALYTPGHAGDHYCFLMGEDGSLFSGDLIVGSGTVVVSPPDGDMDEYLASLRALRTYGIRTILPGHWDRVDDPEAKITEYIDHRLEREQQIIAAMRAGDRTTLAMVARIYPDVDRRLRAAARASVTAHLISLQRRGLVRFLDTPDGREYELVVKDL